jgi:hypothetical protein
MNATRTQPGLGLVRDPISHLWGCQIVATAKRCRNIRRSRRDGVVQTGSTCPGISLKTTT